MVLIAEICRSAGLSNGIFYGYYEGKEAIFRELLERYLAILSKRLAGLAGDTVEQRREGQYWFPGYEKSLRQILMRAIAKAPSIHQPESRPKAEPPGAGAAGTASGPPVLPEAQSWERDGSSSLASWTP
jgi:AcrR family transcriptional regulator